MKTYMPIWHRGANLLAVCASPLDRPRKAATGVRARGRVVGRRPEWRWKEEPVPVCACSGRLSCLATLHPWTSIARRHGAERLSLSPARMRDLSRVANPARSGTVLASLPKSSSSSSSFVLVATRAGLSEGDDVTGIRDVLKRRHGGNVWPHFNGVPPVRRVPRWKIDGSERLTAEVRVSRVRGVPCELTPMVFENIEMRNPAGFLLEDARHGYIQYIRYLPSRFTPRIC